MTSSRDRATTADSPTSGTSGALGSVATDRLDVDPRSSQGGRGPGGASRPAPTVAPATRTTS